MDLSWFCCEKIELYGDFRMILKRKFQKFNRGNNRFLFLFRKHRMNICKIFEKKYFFYYFLFFLNNFIDLYIYVNVMNKHDDSWARQKGVAQWLEHAYAWGWRIKFAIYADYGDAWVLDGCWIWLLLETERVMWVMQITNNWLMIHSNVWESRWHL